MLSYFLFFFYLFFGILLLHWIIRRKIFPFTIYHTASIILFKVVLGCLYGWIFLHYYGGDDTWSFFNESKTETDLLLRHPVLFVREIMPVHSLELTNNDGWKATLFYIRHFERWFLEKGLGILNLLSGKNYYTDLVLFEFLTIAGPMLLFKMLARRFPNRIGMNFLLIFFIPSVTFWCSGIRAEALILLSMVLMLYNGEAYAIRPSLRNILGIVFGFLGILLIRYQFLPLFFLLFLAYMISLQKKTVSPVFFIRILLIAAAVYFISLFMPPSYQLSKPVQVAQQGFFRLHGNTRYPLDSLKPGPLSPVEIFPQALANSIFRPYPWEGKNLLQSFSSIDVLFLLTGVFFFFLSADSRAQIRHPLYWFFLCYALIQMIGIGYVVPFPGAIVRYRIIPLLFLVLFLYSGNPMLQQKLRYRIFKLH